MNEQIAARKKTVTKQAIAVSAVVAGAFTFGGIVLADKHHYPNSPDSFLSYQVDSTSELVAALRSDQALRQRYARHFGIPEDKVIDFVKSALVPYQLPSDRSVTVYGVTKSGRIYATRSRLRKGTKVWATRSGVPVLKWLCANPLTKTLPGTKVAKARSTKVKPKTKVAGTAPAAPAAATDVDIPIAETPLLSLPPVATTALTTPDLPSPLSPTPSALLPPGPVVAKANYGLLFPVGLVLLSTLGGGNGGGGIGGAVSPVGPPVVIGPEAPEPGSLALVLAAGIPAAGALYRRRRAK